MHASLPAPAHRDHVAFSLIVLSLVVSLANGGSAQICGDCDVNGLVNIVDALTGAQHSVATITLTGQGLDNCDVNSSGNVDIVDALFIAQFSSGLPIALNCSGVPMSPGTCAMPVMLTSGVARMGTNVGAANNLAGGCSSIFGFAPEIVHSLAVTGSNVTITVNLTASFAACLYIRKTSCTNPDLGCDVMSPYSITLNGQTTGTYLIIVDGDASGMSGQGNFTVTATAN